VDLVESPRSVPHSTPGGVGREPDPRAAVVDYIEQLEARDDE